MCLSLMSYFLIPIFIYSLYKNVTNLGHFQEHWFVINNKKYSHCRSKQIKSRDEIKIYSGVEAPSLLLKTAFPCSHNGSITTATWLFPAPTTACFTSCSSADWPASPSPRRGHPHWWRRWPGCTSCGDVGNAGRACP